MDRLNLIALFALISITVASLLISKLLQRRFCPICAAAVLVWSVGLVAIYFDLSLIHPEIIAILTGASMGAIAERYGKKFGFLWKSVWVISGTFGLYYLIVQKPATAALFVIINVVFSLISTQWKPKTASGEDLFKNCC